MKTIAIAKGGVVKTTTTARAYPVREERSSRKGEIPPKPCHGQGLPYGL